MSCRIRIEYNLRGNIEKCYKLDSVEVRKLKNFNHDIGRFLNCEVAQVAEERSFSYEVKKIGKKIIGKPREMKNEVVLDGEYGVFFNVDRKDDESFVNMYFYENGVCISEYVDFSFESIETNIEEEDEIEYKRISFIPKEKNKRVLSLDISPDFSVMNRFNPPVDFNKILAELLDTSEAETDEDGINHYILKNSHGEFVVEAIPIEKWEEEVYEDSVILSYSYVEQNITVSQYKNRKYIGGCNGFSLGNIKKEEDALLFYSKDKGFSGMKIDLKPFIKIRHIALDII